MSCMRPLVAFPSRKRNASGKLSYIPVGLYDPDLVDNYSGKHGVAFKMGADGCATPILLPCGKCIGCRLDKSREWALRCMMELKTCKGIAIFVTLTYNESRVPMTYYADPDTGLALPALTLRLDDLQRFWKRLRKSLPDTKVRYFACGEYGERTLRPHYHAIIFGYYPDDLSVYQVCDTTTYYKSDFLDRVWNAGNVLVAPVNFNTCAYVARYTAKKYMTLDDSFFDSHNLEKPFLVMSRRPGIGWDYMQEHMSYFDSGKIYVNGEDPVDGSIPRSFISKLEKIDPELYAEVKLRQQNYGNVYERAIAKAHTVPYSKLLADAEANLLARSKAIKRNKV